MAPSPTGGSRGPDGVAQAPQPLLPALPTSRDPRLRSLPAARLGPVTCGRGPPPPPSPTLSPGPPHLDSLYFPASSAALAGGLGQASVQGGWAEGSDLGAPGQVQGQGRANPPASLQPPPSASSSGSQTRGSGTTAQAEVPLPSLPRSPPCPSPGDPKLEGSHGVSPRFPGAPLGGAVLTRMGTDRRTA